MSMYDLYRRMSLESLQADAELQAQRLADLYRSNMAALRETKQQAARYDRTPMDDPRWTVIEAQWHDQYQAGLADLSAQITQQEALINADYDAKERDYAGAMGAWPTATPHDPLPDWRDGGYTPAPAYGPRPISDTPLETPADVPPDGESLIDTLRAWFG